MLFILLLVIPVIILPSFCHGTISYQDVQSLDEFCYPYDSCKFNETIACKCDNQCDLYADCCIDSSYRSNHWRKRPFICQKQQEYSFYGVYVKSVCPGRNIQIEIRQKCEEISLSSDIELQVPVFNSHSSMMYRNYYCALCNNDQNNLKFWDVKIFCNYPASEKQIMENLVYNDKQQTWGFWDYSTEKNIWVPCAISPQLPFSIFNFRECSSDVISECHSQWRNDRVRNKCNSYESQLLSQDGKEYKNVYCALCNNVNISDLKCKRRLFTVLKSGGVDYGAGLPRGILTINFYSLIDINLKKGNKIGKLNECPKGQIYDEGFRRCAEVFCIGNRIPRGGKCVVP